VSRVKSIPATTYEGLKPRTEIHWRGICRHSNIPEIAGAIACGNIEAAAESDREVRKISANALTLLKGSHGAPSGIRVLIIEGDVAMDKVANRLDSLPSCRGVTEKRPGSVHQ